MTPGSTSVAVMGAGLPAPVARAVDGALAYLAAALAIGSIVVLFLALGGEVIVRYLTSKSLGWPTELPHLLFPWLVMSSIVLAAQRGQHVAVTVIFSYLSPAAAKLLLLVMQVAVAATFFYLAYIGMAVIEITATEVYPMTGLSSRWAYFSLIFGFVGIAVTAVTTFVHLLSADNPLAVRVHDPEGDL